MNNDGVVDEDDFDGADMSDDDVVNKADDVNNDGIVNKADDVSAQNVVKVTITASLKGVERSKTLVVRGVEASPP